MIDVIAAAAFALAWFVFRYDRHAKRLEAMDAAQGVLRAVHHGMVQGLTPGQAVGWGQLYFQHDYTEGVAATRARDTHFAVMGRHRDEIFVVPTEPLAKLATTTPHPGLIEASTVAVANHALWHVHVFNQLVNQLTDFNARHAVEIESQATDDARREELAAAASSISVMVHLYGIGLAWSHLPGGGRGWYGALVEVIGGNLTQLASAISGHRWQWTREWPYNCVDLLVVGGFVAVSVAVLSGLRRAQSSAVVTGVVYGIKSGV